MSGLLVYGADLRDGGVVQMKDGVLGAWADKLSPVERAIAYGNIRLADLVSLKLRRDGDDCEQIVQRGLSISFTKYGSAVAPGVILSLCRLAAPLGARMFIELWKLEKQAHEEQYLNRTCIALEALGVSPRSVVIGWHLLGGLYMKEASS